MDPVSLDVKLEVILDNNEQPRYFPGDAIHGKIFVTANQSYTLRHFRLAWTGRIQVGPIQSNKYKHTYFNECWKLGPILTNSLTKDQTGSTNVPSYVTELVLAATVSEEPIVELQKNETIALAFTVYVPNDRSLPSCTEYMDVFPDRIIYMLAAFIVNAESKQKFFGKRVVPVYEAIYTRSSDIKASQTGEQVFQMSLFSEKRNCTSSMRVIIPCRGCLPGVEIPVYITIWDNMKFMRMRFISITLFRVKQILANGRTYVFDQHEVERTIATIRDANFDTEDDNQRAQAAHARILIPSYIMPTITLEQSRLLGIRYFIQVKILENDGIYTTVDGKHLQYMMVDLPFTVGTLRTPSNSSSLSEPISVPFLRTPSNSSSLSEPISVPSLAHQYLTKTPPSISSSVHSSSTTSISLTRTPPSISSSIHSSSTTSISLTSIYRRFTQSSGSLNERRSRKRDLFQSLRNSKRNSDPSTLQVHGRNNLMMNQEDDDSISSVKLQNQVPPTVLVEPKSSKVDISLNIAAEKGAFDIIAGDGINDIEEAKPEKKPVVSSEIKKEESCVFKMFPDDDDDDDDEPDTIQSQTASNSKYISRKEAVFKIFCDGEEDEDSDAENIASAKDEHEQLIDAINDRIESFVNDQQYKKQSNVFKMFNDDDSSSEEEAVIDAPVKSRLEEPRYHKPNEYI